MQISMLSMVLPTSKLNWLKKEKRKKKGEWNARNDDEVTDEEIKKQSTRGKKGTKESFHRQMQTYTQTVTATNARGSGRKVFRMRAMS